MADALSSSTHPAVILGDGWQSGAYVLGISLRTPLTLAFGRFQNGRPVSLGAGRYVYVGSAMGQRGSSSLAHRLLRHATRSDGRPPQTIRPALLAALQVAGLGPKALRPPVTKRVRWHVDYLLDEPAVTLSRVLAVRSERPLEHELAEWVAARPETEPLAPGLGASDHPGHTHLFAAAAVDALWDELTGCAASL